MLVGGLALAACSSGASSPTSASKGDCPTAPLAVVVSVDQWGDIVDQLAGDCGEVTTIIKSSSADPHDYEPTPADHAKFTGAELVVVNGLDYDPWADKAVGRSAPAGASSTAVTSSACKTATTRTSGTDPTSSTSRRRGDRRARDCSHPMPRTTSTSDRRRGARRCSRTTTRSPRSRPTAAGRPTAPPRRSSTTWRRPSASRTRHRTATDAAAERVRSGAGRPQRLRAGARDGTDHRARVNTQTEERSPSSCAAAEAAKVPVVEVTETCRRSHNVRGVAGQPARATSATALGSVNRRRSTLDGVSADAGRETSSGRRAPSRVPRGHGRR